MKAALHLLEERWLGPLLIAPVVVVLGTVIAYPLFATLILSAFAVDTPTLRAQFVGAGNYVELLGVEGRFWAALGVTLVWTAATLTLGNDGQVVALIPTRYVGSGSGSAAEMLARATGWRDAGAETFVGMGQRVLSTDTGDVALLDARTIRLNAG